MKFREDGVILKKTRKLIALIRFIKQELEEKEFLISNLKRVMVLVWISFGVSPMKFTGLNSSYYTLTNNKVFYFTNC